MSNNTGKSRHSTACGDGPFVVLNPEELKVIMLRQDMPFLMVCILRNETFHEQMDIIKSVIDQFDGLLSAYVISEELIASFCKKYNVKGTPTFLFYLNGKERDRILGCTNQESLAEFVARNLQTINRLT